MREEKLLVKILRGIADLIAEEASSNPEFALRLGKILEDVSQKNKAKPAVAIENREIPDLFEEARNRDSQEFELWLGELSLPTLKALIHKHDLDSSKKTAKWKEIKKVAKFIAERFLPRLQRGSAFLTGLKANPASSNS